MNNIELAHISINIQYVKNEFGLNNDQADQLSRTIENYSRLTRFDLFSLRLKNILKRIFFIRGERSEWKIAKDTIKVLARDLIKNHTAFQNSKISGLKLARKADQLSQFILKFLVTANRPTSPLALSKKVCNSRQLKEIFSIERAEAYHLNALAIDRIILTGIYKNPQKKYRACLAKVEKLLRSLNEGLKSHTSNEDCKIYKAYQTEKKAAPLERKELDLRRTFDYYERMKGKFHPLKLFKVDD